MPRCLQPADADAGSGASAGDSSGSTQFYQIKWVRVRSGSLEFSSESQLAVREQQKYDVPSVVSVQVSVPEESASDCFSALHQRQLSPLQSLSASLGSTSAVDQPLSGPQKPESRSVR